MPGLKVIILAAGKGTRMKSDVPKVLHEICGQPIIDYVLDLVSSLKIFGCVVVGHQAKIIGQHLPKGFTAVHQKRLLGTADAVKSASSLFQGYSGNILIVCADTPLLKKETLRTLICTHQKNNAAVTFLTSEVSCPQGYGRVIRNKQREACAIREEKDANSQEKKICEVNTGVYCFKARDLFQSLPSVRMNARKREYYLTDIIAIFAQHNKKISTVSVEDIAEGLGINSRQHLAQAGAILRQRILEKLMDQGVTIVDPATTYIDVNVTIGKDTVIQPCVVIEKDVVIGEKCVIGPFCHLRPKTKIKKGVQIGNFTEVSRSEIGPETVMKHFGFLGDARIGQKVNIGAGTVTANYDGRNKNITRIGHQAFIGSDSILVAPVTIGQKATTGAGCVVTKGKKIPAGSLVLGVPGQVRRKGKKNE